MKDSTTTSSGPVRFGIVGMGVMGNRHARAILNDCGEACALGAVADSFGDAAAKAGEAYGVPSFTDPGEMFASGLIDAAVIATPHYLHPVQTIRAARAGLHVLCEKPLAVTIGPARAMLAECAKQGVALGCVLQMRTRGVMMKMKEMVAAGQIGEIFRCSMTCSNWYRTQAYYDSGAWRGTWDGEGGGILLNQAPHSLDLFQWIGGMPTRVQALTATRLHRIEVENVACAVLQYEGAKVGSLYLTSSEVPGVDQFTVVGDKGTLICENGALRIGELSEPISRHIFECDEAGADDIIPPACTWRDVEIADDPGGTHANVLNAFAAHVLGGEPMVASGEEAIRELEISSAVYLSSHTAQAVDIPVDAAACDALIGQLAAAAGAGDPDGMRLRAQRELEQLLAE